MINLISLIDFAGTSAFAASGALLAARHRLDIIGFIFVGCITGIGGGTLRDLFLNLPVFWVEQWHYVAICGCAAIFTYFATRFVNRGTKALLWADAVGMALFSVLGAQKALALGISIPVAAIMGVFSACFGGVIRDTLLNEVPIIFQKEIYITASLTGALGYCITAELTGLPNSIAILIGCLAAFTVRALAITRNLSIPSHAGLD